MTIAGPFAHAIVVTRQVKQAIPPAPSHFSCSRSSPLARRYRRTWKTIEATASSSSMMKPPLKIGVNHEPGPPALPNPIRLPVPSTGTRRLRSSIATTSVPTVKISAAAA
ncbi:MAG: hypothetical protein ACRDLP_07220 [Solirubrobacteraceae bacterium]